MIRRMLLPISGSALTPSAVSTAVALARAHGAHLTGISFRAAPERAWLSPLGGVSGVTRVRNEEASAAWHRVAAESERFLHACADDAVPCELLSPQGDPFEVLLTHGGAYDLVVFGLRGLFDHPLVDRPPRLIARLISEGLGPTLAVVERPVLEPAAILVALSGSPASLRALRDLLYLGLHAEAPLHLLHIGEDDAMLERAADLARDHGRRVDSVEVADGPVQQTIADHARQRDCELIVMGDSGRSLLVRDVLGDVALGMMRDSELPLLLSH